MSFLTDKMVIKNIFNIICSIKYICVFEYYFCTINTFIFARNLFSKVNITKCLPCKCHSSHKTGPMLKMSLLTHKRKLSLNYISQMQTKLTSSNTLM